MIGDAGFWFVVALIFVAGVLGGLISFALSGQTEGVEGHLGRHLSSDNWWKCMLSSLVMGVGAAFIMPVFLNLISSDLLENVLTDQSGGESGSGKKKDSFFVLFGSCLIAAASSRNFITMVSSSVMSRLKDQIDDVQQRTNQALEMLDEPESADDSIVNHDKGQLNSVEKGIINTMYNGKYTMRSEGGLMVDMKATRDDVRPAITSLLDKKIIEQGKNSKGMLRWYLSAQGRCIAERLNKAGSEEAPRT